MLVIRLIFAVVCIAAGYHFQPFHLTKLLASSQDCCSLWP